MNALYPFTLNESIYFDYTPPPTFAGHINRHPFKINIISTSTDPHIVYLDAKYSKSYPPQVPPNKWSFLRPEYRFYDLNNNKIDSIITKDTTLYIDNDGVLNSVSGTYVGVSGTAEFYFTDDIYNFDLAVNNQPYTTIIATLITSGIVIPDPNSNTDYLSPNFGNSSAVAYQPHIFYYRQPDYLKISENGIRDFVNPRWSSIYQPIVFSINWNTEYQITLNDGNEITPYNASSNFCHYFPNQTNQTKIPINFGIVGLSSHFISPVEIDYQDNDGYLTAGYNRNYFYVPPTTTSSAIITGSCVLQAPSTPLASSYSPRLWISNPNAGVVCIANYNEPQNFPKINNKNFQIAQLHNFDVPIVYQQSYSTNSFSTTGYHGINSIAAINYPYCQAWACDSELNYLYKFGFKGDILSAIDINKVVKDNNLGFLINNQVSPNSIVLDSSGNIWMTLYDTVSVLKFDKDANFLFAVNPLPYIGYSSPPNINSQWYYYNEDYPFTGETQNFIEPTFIDTDKDNNIWVTYSNYASGYLLQYDENGNPLTVISYPVNSCPQELVIDNQNNVWVGLSNNIFPSLGSIEKRDSYGNLIAAFAPIRGLNNLTLDNNQNLWFTYDYQSIGKINNSTAAITTIDVSQYSDYSKYAPKDISNPLYEGSESALEGIACDARGLLYVINSIENQIYVFDTNTNQFLNKFYINPKGFSFYAQNEKGLTLITYNKWKKSACAYGDWTGNRWSNKYYVNNILQTINLSGKSVNLNFYTSAVDVYKINENFNLKNQMKSVAFMDIFQNSTFLFDTFFGSIFGNNDHNDLGVSSYEKIANFIENNTDVDTCEIDQLYSIAQSTNENTDDYRLSYPNDLKRLVNLLSINQARLWGSELQDNNNFNSSSKNGVLNRGLLLTNFYNVSAGTPLILKSKSINRYELIPTGFINGLSSYPIKNLANFIGLPDDWPVYYEFYEYIPKTSQTQAEGIIDWSNPNTTINKNISSYYNWVGDQQTIDSIFSYHLYNGLGLINQ